MSKKKKEGNNTEPGSVCPLLASQLRFPSGLAVGPGLKAMALSLPHVFHYNKVFSFVGGIKNPQYAQLGD